MWSRLRVVCVCHCTRACPPTCTIQLCFCLLCRFRGAPLALSEHLRRWVDSCSVEMGRCWAAVAATVLCAQLCIAAYITVDDEQNLQITSPGADVFMNGVSWATLTANLSNIVASTNAVVANITASASTIKALKDSSVAKLSKIEVLQATYSTTLVNINSISCYAARGPFDLADKTVTQHFLDSFVFNATTFLVTTSSFGATVSTWNAERNRVDLFQSALGSNGSYSVRALWANGLPLLIFADQIGGPPKIGQYNTSSHQFFQWTDTNVGRFYGTVFDGVRANGNDYIASNSNYNTVYISIVDSTNNRLINVQNITSFHAVKYVRFFTMGSDTYLAVAYSVEIAGEFANSTIYKLTGTSFQYFQPFLSWKCSQLLPFAFKGVQYLLVVNGANTTTGNLTSSHIYRFESSSNSFKFVNSVNVTDRTNVVEIFTMNAKVYFAYTSSPVHIVQWDPATNVLSEPVLGSVSAGYAFKAVTIGFDTYLVYGNQMHKFCNGVFV
eukprot:m.76346 g.76346  ORF g.76346 m.76346 type:complete len:498 (-) comp50453_c0_seq2:57-1550(-)